jgi:hypothetical protein
MNDTETTTALTADHIRDMVRGITTPHETQQSWIWRSLLYCFREMQKDMKQYRSDIGRVDNRNSPAYWIDWMANGGLNKNSACSEIHAVILRDAKHPPRVLSGRHLDNAVTFLTTEGVAEAVLRFVQRPL